MLNTGELAAIGTSVFWAISAILFTIAGRRVGSSVVNLTRLIMAFFIISLVHRYILGTLFPFHTEGWRWQVLALSAVLGLVIGDAALFFAYVRIGPQLAMLVMTLTPVLSALAAWFCFGEQITQLEAIGIAITIAAIGWVVTERTDEAVPNSLEPNSKASSNSLSRYLVGVLCAFIGALGQTANLVVTKYALVDNYPPLSATQVRILISACFLLGWAVCRGESRAVISKLRDRRAMWLTAGGAIVGPILGIWLSYIAINHTRIGIASTIMATPPLLLIPLGAVFLDDRITLRSVIGTLVAVVGVATLFLN